MRGYAANAILSLYAFESEDVWQKLTAYALAEKLERALCIPGRIMDQTGCRVLGGEKVPERSLSMLEMVKSNWVYKKLRNFRAGIEANIFWLKRFIGLDYCTWRGCASFRRYLRSTIFSQNLMVLTRLQLAKA